MATDIILQQLTQVAKRQCACASGAMKLLVNTSKFASTSSHSAHSPIPDFLLPAFTRGTPTSPPLSHVHPTFRRRVGSRAAHVEHHRSISTSPATRAVVVTANPRKDVDGNEMLIDITTRAANVCGFLTLVSIHRRLLTEDPATQRDNGQGPTS